MLTTRKATEEDFKTVLELNREIQAIHEEGQPKLFKPANEMDFPVERFKKIIESPNVWLIIAEIDDKPAGYALSEIFDRKLNPYFKDCKMIYINHLVVSFAYRGRGIGKKLMQHVLEKCKANEIHRIEIDVWTFNKKAKAFYQNLGFQVFNEKLFLAC